MRRQISGETMIKAASAFRSINQLAHVLHLSRATVHAAMRQRNVEEQTAEHIENEFSRLDPTRHMATLERLINECHATPDSRALITIDEAYNIQALIKALIRKVDPSGF